MLNREWFKAANEAASQRVRHLLGIMYENVVGVDPAEVKQALKTAERLQPGDDMTLTVDICADGVKVANLTATVKYYTLDEVLNPDGS